MPWSGTGVMSSEVFEEVATTAVAVSKEVAVPPEVAVAVAVVVVVVVAAQ